ncbi:MAG: alpha-L-fucosidase [Thermoanaerobaculia bacterium]|nr:alpha-L-fucosidase [Thermoanaerobaculia bacterium]
MNFDRPSRRELFQLAAGTVAALGVPSMSLANRALHQGVDPRLHWWLDAGFGLFLHWGPYSVAGVEASWPIMVPAMASKVPQPAITEEEYTSLADRFDPADYDPVDWVRRARRAGMRYIVLTAKHHDGYCLFDAPGTTYKSTAGPSGRDLCAELAAACEREGMPLGFYYSPPDMHHPGYRDVSRPATENWTGEPERAVWADYLDYMEAHLRKLLTDYGRVAIVWFDGLFDHGRYQPERFHRLVRELGPDTITNDRLGPGDYSTPEQSVLKGVPVRRDPGPGLDEPTFLRVIDLLASDLPQEQIEALFAAGFDAIYPTAPDPPPEKFQPWETCMTMNRAWGHVPTDTSWKAPESLVRTLIEARSRGGNLLLNVGPTGTGRFPAEAEERLEAIGRWIDRHEEAIRAVTWGPVQGVPQVRSTRSVTATYLALFDRGAETLELEGLAPTTRIERMADGVEIAADHRGGRLALRLPAPLDPWVDVLRVR